MTVSLRGDLGWIRRFKNAKILDKFQRSSYYGRQEQERGHAVWIAEPEDLN
jgi:hypothetical protein